MKTLKEQIKNLAEGQKDLKNQRKSVYIVGERKMTPGQAFVQHQINREKLLNLYIEYAILRGKDAAWIKEHIYANVIVTDESINKVKVKYGQEAIRLSA